DRMQGTTVTLYQDDVSVDKASTDKNGRFKFELDYNHIYVLEFSRNGYVTKRLHINTNDVPEENAKFGHEFGGFVVSLFKEMEGLDVSILEQPIGKVFYDPGTEQFEYDRKYTKSIQAEVERLRKELEERAREEERLQAQKEEDFRLAMKDAEAAMAEKDYLSAMEHYEAASGINPEAKEPKSQMVKLEKLIAEEGQEEERYMSLLNSADAAFQDANYTQAQADYRKASDMRPAETYPKDQLKEVDRLLAAQKKLNESYNSFIAKADKAFQGKEYAQAKTSYQEALNLKPEESYPAGKLSEIDQLLANQAAAETAAAEKRARYQELITQADAALGQEKYADAKAR
ncbi:MAG: hypothetical protein AAGB22_15770, partial [Bacteroidota bacterium]